jgi:hypothetical protein
MDKIELWPKEVYDENLRNLLEGGTSDFSLAKMTEEAFGLLHASEATTPKEAVQSVMNPLYASHK